MSIDNYIRRQTYLFDILRTILFWLVAIALLLILCPKIKTGAGNHGSGSQGVMSTQDGDGAGAMEGADVPSNTLQDAADANPESPQESNPAPSQSTDNTQGKTPPPPMTLPNENVRHFGTPSANAPVVRKGGSNKGFFGVDVGENEGNLLFLLDVSGSMGGLSSENITRLDLLKKELTRLLRETSAHHKNQPKPTTGFRNLNSKGTFQIIQFSDTPVRCPPSGQIFNFDDDTDINTAISHIKKLELMGGTHFLSAWQMVEKLHKSMRIDTVFFLSDGEDNSLTPDWINTHLPHIRIHTFSMGTSSQLLQTIATQHNGTYTIVQ